LLEGCRDDSQNMKHGFKYSMGEGGFTFDWCREMRTENEKERTKKKKKNIE